MTVQVRGKQDPQDLISKRTKTGLVGSVQKLFELSYDANKSNNS